MVHFRNIFFALALLPVPVLRRDHKLWGAGDPGSSQLWQATVVEHSPVSRAITRPSQGQTMANKVATKYSLGPAVLKVKITIKIKITPPPDPAQNPGLLRKTTVRTLPRDPPGEGGGQGINKNVLKYSWVGKLGSWTVKL